LIEGKRGREVGRFELVDGGIEGLASDGAETPFGNEGIVT